MTKSGKTLVLTEDAIIPFGKKYNGRKVSQLIKENPGYLLWIHENHDYAVLSPEVLAKCYDAKPVPQFEFKLQELRKHREEMVELLGYPGKDITPGARYAIELMQHLEDLLSRKEEATIRLTKGE